MGNGGHHLWIAPALGLVAAAFCGACHRPDMWLTPTLLLQRSILAGLARA